MYIPKSFLISEADTINQFIDNNAFGQLISKHQQNLFCSHMPFLYNPNKGLLTGHLGKANPQHRDIEGQEVLITLQGAHGYISPSWYQSKSVPTWNYQAVHLYGHCQVFDEPEKLKYVVDHLADKYEQRLPNPWQPDYHATMLKGIIGIEVYISKIECKFKLNQNRSAKDIQGVINNLDPISQSELLAAMKSIAPG